MTTLRSLSAAAGPAGRHPSAEEVLSQGRCPAALPDLSWRAARPLELRQAISPGRLQAAGFRVEAREIPHRGGRTIGFRVSDGRSAVAYVTDHCPTALGPGPDGWGEYHPAAARARRRGRRAGPRRPAARRGGARPGRVRPCRRRVRGRPGPPGRGPAGRAVPSSAGPDRRRTGPGGPPVRRAPVPVRWPRKSRSSTSSPGSGPARARGHRPAQAAAGSAAGGRCHGLLRRPARRSRVTVPGEVLGLVEQAVRQMIWAAALAQAVDRGGQDGPGRLAVAVRFGEPGPDQITLSPEHGRQLPGWASRPGRSARRPPRYRRSS